MWNMYAPMFDLFVHLRLITTHLHIFFMHLHTIMCIHPLLLHFCFYAFTIEDRKLDFGQTSEIYFVGNWHSSNEFYCMDNGLGFSLMATLLGNPMQ